MFNFPKSEIVAYVAGVMDGEGCFMIRPKGGRETHYRPRVTMTNTSEAIVLYVHQFLASCSIKSTFGSQLREGNRKRCYYVELAGRRSIDRFCIMIRPYLIAKQMQCNALLEFIALRDAEGDINDTFCDRKLALFELVRELNKRGK